MPIPLSIEERRGNAFTQKLSVWMVVMAAVGALIVLLEPKFIYVFDGGSSVTIGGIDFSEQVQGLVIGLILIKGFQSVTEYHLGQSASGQQILESQSRIAEAAAPVVAAVAAEAASNGLKSRLMKNHRDEGDDAT